MKVDRIIEAGILATFAAFVGVLFLSLHDNVVKAGDRAPDFSIRADNGKIITAKDFGGKLLLLNFWATWCPPCISEVPALNQLQRALGPDVGQPRRLRAPLRGKPSPLCAGRQTGGPRSGGASG